MASVWNLSSKAVPRGTYSPVDLKRITDVNRSAHARYRNGVRSEWSPDRYLEAGRYGGGRQDNLSSVECGPVGHRRKPASPLRNIFLERYPKAASPSSLFSVLCPKHTNRRRRRNHLDAKSIAHQLGSVQQETVRATVAEWKTHRCERCIGLFDQLGPP